MRILKNLILTLSLLSNLVSYAQDPDAPIITFLSVDHSTQQVEINWVNSTPNVVGYVIYFEDISGLWIPLDTVMGIANTTYLTSNASPQQKKKLLVWLLLTLWEIVVSEVSHILLFFSNSIIKTVIHL